MLRYSADCKGSPAAAWALLARPGRWHEWAPQLRGAWGLTQAPSASGTGGEGEVRPGAVGAARLLGVVPVPARIISVDPGRSWSWRVGPVTLDHRVERRPNGRSRVIVEMHAALPIEAALRVTYGPVVQLLVMNLARVAGREA